MTDLDAQAFFLVYNKYIDDDPLSFEALLLKTFFPSFLWRPFHDKKKEKESGKGGYGKEWSGF